MKKHDKKYWTSIDQLKDTPEYRKTILDSFHGENEAESENTVSRRNFLALMGASMALAGLAGCRKPVEKIIPYVSQPEVVIPGVPQYYATTMPFGLSSYGLIVESHEGRPTKVEGNPDHPSSLGSTDFLTQATTLGLYDPDRSKVVKNKGAEAAYADFVTFWRGLYDQFSANNGAGLAVLSEEFSSPTLSNLRNEFLKNLPNAKWVAYEPVSDENIYRAIKNVTGNQLRPVYNYDRAKVILSLDSDFLQNESEPLTAARGFADGRRMVNKDDSMNRLYVVENAYSITGSMADHRMAVPSGQISRVLIALLHELKKHGAEIGSIPPDSEHSFDKRWISALARDLIANRGKSLVVAGYRQPATVHELVLLLNNALGNIGQTLNLIPLKDAALSDTEKLKELCGEMSSGNIDTLIILGGNPVYNTPVDFQFQSALSKIKNTIHFSEYYDETSRLATWHIPRSHYLESWGDTRSANGTLGVIQPLIEPLYGTHSDSEMYALFATGRDRRGYDIVRETWAGILKKSDFEKEWRRILHDGLQKADPLPSAGFRMVKNFRTGFSGNIPNSPAPTSESLEVGFYKSKVYDGRYANNGWLQELPHPITKLAWTNAAIIGPGTAKNLGLKNNDIIDIKINDRSIEIPVWVIPGQADNTICLALGYGRQNIGRVADNIGADTYRLRSSDGISCISGAAIFKTGKKAGLANTQDHNRMEGRPIIREAALSEYRKHPEFAREMVEHPPLKSIYPEFDYSKGYQWGMVIDLNTCIGCAACTIACQGENNVPIVGEKQVHKGREMHWMRIDRYYAGDTDQPEIVHQPVPCQQCENAPCETVCPVAATVHDKEGLNNMTYNRCIGTRYCSNNCPYKVRRFNFFNYTGKLPETVRMAQNPDVTVRSRGVMEKCTFCIQRINRAKQTAKKEGRKVRDGEITTACEQACPTKAISFGNIIEPESKVKKLKERDRNYELLAEFNVRPRNSYLAKIRNPNPELVPVEENKPENGHG